MKQKQIEINLMNDLIETMSKQDEGWHQTSHIINWLEKQLTIIKQND